MSPSRSRPMIRVLIALVAMAGLAACASDTAVPAAAPAPIVAPQLVVPPPPVASLPDQPVATSGALSVRFLHDNADITGSAMQILWNNAPAMQAAPLALIRIQGFTDASGSTAYNRALSLRRAQAVAKQLRTLGITAERIEIVGQGIDSTAGKGHAKRADLRRVEVSWVPAAAPRATQSGAAAFSSSSNVRSDLGAAPSLRLGALAPHPVTAIPVATQLGVDTGNRPVVGLGTDRIIVASRHLRLPSVRAGPSPAA